MAKNIIKLKFDDSNIYDIRPYATCDTGAATQTKLITLNGFAVVPGAVIMIKFTNGNTYTHTTNKVQLKINNGDKINVSTQNLIIGSGDVVEFICNEIGSGSTKTKIWDVIGGVGCSTADIEGLF
jgi:hypothetical protein